MRKPWGARSQPQWEEAMKKALEADGALASLIAGSAVPAMATPASPHCSRIQLPRGLSS